MKRRKHQLTKRDRQMLQAIVAKSCAENGMLIEDFDPKNQTNEHCTVKYMAYYLAVRVLGISQVKVKRYFEFEQHNSIYNGINRIEEWREVDKLIEEKLSNLTAVAHRMKISTGRQLSFEV
jgi:chromosomal replication initiation ATPase DnaA